MGRVLATRLEGHATTLVGPLGERVDGLSGHSLLAPAAVPVRP